MSIGYSYSGYTKFVSPSWLDGNALVRVLNNPLARPIFVRDLILWAPDFALRFATWGALALELTFVPLALSRRARPWIWTAMLAFHLGLTVLIDFADLSFGMVILHLFTFDPRWVPNRWSERRDQLFYDGACGLCHGATRFILSEDRSGSAFTFAALQGESFAQSIPSEQRKTLPDSIVVRTDQGELLVRSDAVIHALQRLGGMWRLIAAAMSVPPRELRDAIYDLMARIRHRVVARSDAVCPVLPVDLRSRFRTEGRNCATNHHHA